jgi:hypothetical protein
VAEAVKKELESWRAGERDTKGRNRAGREIPDALCLPE